MIIVYESKTGFTKKYADILAKKTNLKAYRTNEIANVSKDEEIIFLGWMNAGRIQGLNKVRSYKIKAVCGSGTGRTAEPNVETVITRNKIENIPFFYLRGGCLPLKNLKGMDKFMMTIFVKILKGRKDKDESLIEAIYNIENGFDGVKEENLLPVLEWFEMQK